MNPLNCSMLLLSLALSTTSCNDYVPSAPTQSMELVKVRGGGKDVTVLADADRLDSLVVKVVDRDGRPVGGAQVTWSQSDPAGRVVPATSVTGADGTTWAKWTLAGFPGVHTASATIADRPAQSFSFRIRSWTAKALVQGANGYRCALAGDGRLSCARLPDRLRPVLVDHRFIDIDADIGGVPQGNGMCALTNVGRIWCADMTQPTLMFNEVAGGHPPFAALAAGGGSTFCAISTGGELWCWGNAHHGLRADGVTTPNQFVSSPVKSNYPGTVALRDVALADDVGCALAQDGVPWCWGTNITGAVNPNAPGTDTEAAPPRAVLTRRAHHRTRAGGRWGWCLWGGPERTRDLLGPDSIEWGCRALGHVRDAGIHRLH